MMKKMIINRVSIPYKTIRNELSPGILRNSPRDTWKLANWDAYVAGRDYSVPSIPALSDCLVKFYNSNNDEFNESIEKITKFLIEE